MSAQGIILEHLQRWTNDIPLIILGSGASVPHGLPNMWKLGDHLKNNLKFTAQPDIRQFEEFKTSLEKTEDLETALSDIQLSENVQNKIIDQTWELINSSDLDAFSEILLKPQDFPLVNLIKYLLKSTSKELSIVTTNYDRLAEYAASLANAFICTGFAQNLIGHFSNQIHNQDLRKIAGYNGRVNIWKVHGSLDWFKQEKDEIPIQLVQRQIIPKNQRPLIVTPGLMKYIQTHIEPIRTIFAEADKEIEKARAFLCIGYGFNDLHVQPKLIQEIKNGKPIIVITKKLTDQTIKAIVENKCEKYILIEQKGDRDTVIHSSFDQDSSTVSDTSYWMLKNYLNLIH